MTGAGRADVSERVLWQEQVSPPDLPDQALPGEVDVVVIGGGYVGLCAAHTLASAGRSVVVVEKGAVGWGAHTRNGGMVIPELKAGPGTLRDRYGPVGTRMYAEVNEAFDFVEGLVGDGGIDCDYVRSGQLYLAHSSRQVPYLEKLAREHAEQFGEDVRFVPRADLGDEIGSDAFAGGVVYERTGALHPARYHAGLLGRALHAGALVVQHCAATSVERRGAGFTTATDRGTVRSAHVIVGTNAYADGLLPELRRRVLPVGSFIVATDPLEPDLARSVSPRGRMFVDTKNLLFYWRLTPDRRLLFGGRRSLASVTLAEARQHLEQGLRRIHPQLADTAITHQWGGSVALTLDRLPHVGRIRGAWYATGCNGSGVGLNSWLGHRLALVVLEQAPPPAFAELSHRTIPLHRWRRAWLPVVGEWFRWQDRR